MAELLVQPGIQTSPVFRVRGQRSRWRYPHPRAEPEFCEEIDNMNLSERGTADSRFGYSEWTSSQMTDAEVVLGLRQETFASSGAQQLLCAKTKIYTDDGTTQKNITGSLSLSAAGNDDRYRFAFMTDKIIATNGKDELWTWSGDYDGGTAAAAISFSGGVTIQACEDLVEHRSILIALGTTEGGTKYPTRLRWCDVQTKTFTLDITKWIDNNRYEIEEGGAPIIGGVDNFGRLLVFKSDGMYAGIINYDAGFIEFRLNEMETLKGFHPVAKNSLISRPEFVFGIAREGAFVIRPDLGFQIVTLDIQDEWNGLNQSRLQYAQSYIREKDHQVRTLVSSSGNGSGHDKILVWDWENGDVFFESPVDRLSFGQRVVLSDTEYDWWGNTQGRVYKANDSAKTDDNGTGYSWRAKTVPNDLGLPGKIKNIINVRTFYSQRAGQAGSTLRVVRDEGRLGSRSKSIAFQGETWDASAEWDATSKWNPGGSTIDTFFVNRYAETISCEWEGNQPINIIGYSVQYQIVE